MGILRDARFFFVHVHVRWTLFFFFLLGHILFVARIRRNMFFIYKFLGKMFFALAFFSFRKDIFSQSPCTSALEHFKLHAHILSRHEHLVTIADISRCTSSIRFE